MLNARDVVVEDVDQLPVRLSDGVHPERLHARALEHASGGPVGELAQTRRSGAGEPLLVGRQPLLQRCRDIDVRVQRVDERRRDLIADLVVGDEFAGGSRDRFGVEALEADVAGQEAQKGQEHAEHGEDAGNDHLHRPCYRTLRRRFNHANGMKSDDQGDERVAPQVSNDTESNGT